MGTDDLWLFRELIGQLRDEGEPGFGAETLLPWIDRHPELVATLREIGHPDNHARRPAGDDYLLHGLYAMSRLVDILISPHQPVDDDPALLAWTTDLPWWSGPVPDRSAWTAFGAGFGVTTIAEDAFHPFFHEIVEVVPDEDPDRAPELVSEHWPGALIGGLLVARAGVTVRAGAHHLDPGVAAKSCLYWAWWRRNREPSDLSHGWGHNSQWRTDFRRDYVVGDQLHYNVDDDRIVPHHEDDFTPELRRQLLRYRHSTTVDLGSDRWPYEERLVESRRP